MSGITTTSTLAVLIDKRPMRKRRRSAKKKEEKVYLDNLTLFIIKIKKIKNLSKKFKKACKYKIKL